MSSDVAHGFEPATSGQLPGQHPERQSTWIEVCSIDRITVDRGVAALIEGVPVAIFRLSGDEVLAIDHVEPFTGVPVLARGIVGSAGDRDVVASPLHKERFDLRTGECLDAPGIWVRTWDVLVIDGLVSVLAQPNPSPL
ncbi:MAG TPA: nitrite reductase small subunit NirD [Ilumatobacter sp.]|nr:nitrite reductase small subunit NirD [Ilumatobacter sp.]